MSHIFLSYSQNDHIFAELIRVKHDRTAKNLLPGEGPKMTSKSASKLAPCPDTPNCVSSLAEDQKHFIEPISYVGENPVAQRNLLGILDSFKGAHVVRLEDDYIRAEFVSSIFRFIDDVEFYFDEARQRIQVRSASRTGYSDLGVNRRRIEKIRKQFDQKERYSQNEAHTKTM